MKKRCNLSPHFHRNPVPLLKTLSLLQPKLLRNTQNKITVFSELLPELLSEPLSLALAVPARAVLQNGRPTPRCRLDIIVALRVYILMVKGKIKMRCYFEDERPSNQSVFRPMRLQANIQTLYKYLFVIASLKKTLCFCIIYPSCIYMEKILYFFSINCYERKKKAKLCYFLSVVLNLSWCTFRKCVE